MAANVLWASWLMLSTTNFAKNALPNFAAEQGKEKRPSSGLH